MSAAADPASATRLAGRQPTRRAAMSPRTAAIGAYLLDSHGSAPIARPRAINTIVRVDCGRHANAIITANAAGISGYTVNELKRNGAVNAVAAHPIVAADADPVSSRARRHNSVAAAAAISTSIATTPP